MAALPAAHPGEALPQVAAAEVLVDRLADDRPEEPVAIFVALGVDLLEALVVLLDVARTAGSTTECRSDSTPEPTLAATPWTKTKGGPPFPGTRPSFRPGTD